MAAFFITARARLHLLDIELYSSEHWGEKQTKQYIADLFKAFQNIADNPDMGKTRQHRYFPFLMAPAGKYYAVYTSTQEGVIIAAALHSKQNIEGIIQEISLALAEEIASIAESSGG